MTAKLDSAYAKCKALAESHYENFPVARLVPKAMRKHVAAVYAFARTADDIADEEHESMAADDPRRIEKLREYEAQLDIEDPSKLDERWCWIFTALANTTKEYQIPKQLYRDLVDAFAQDVVKKRYASFKELQDYCRRSANPVGRLILILHGYKDEELYKLSDYICTGLQLANFWQDMCVDKLKNRIYIPQEDWCGLTEAEIFADTANEKLRAVVRKQVDRTEQMFGMGAPLVKCLKFPLSLEIKLSIAGGRGILEKIRKQNYDTLAKRPTFTKFDKVKLLTKALLP